MLIKTAFAILLVVAACVTSYGQEDESKRPSPAAQAQCKFSGGKTITVDYSSPRMRGRKVFGELVPYGEVWRTGANEATTFVTNEDLVTVKGTNISAGSYTIFTVPNPDEWTVIINKHTGEWGICPSSLFKTDRKRCVFIKGQRSRTWPAAPRKYRGAIAFRVLTE